MCCPPAPLALKVSTFKSAGFISISTSLTSGNTATVAVDVWILPLDSVSGTLCTLWTPLSNFNLLYAPFPVIIKVTSFIPPSSVSFKLTTSNFQRFFSAYILYILNKSAANNEDSSPPAPPLISTITFLSSLGSFGTNRSFNSSSILGSFSLFSSSSAWAKSCISLSLSISFKSSIAFSTFLYSLYFSTISAISACSFISFCHSDWFAITSGSLIFWFNSS